ncbi:hypothetical protein MGG_16104, partial [Pyricularia oryzae 70-15]
KILQFYQKLKLKIKDKISKFDRPEDFLEYADSEYLSPLFDKLIRDANTNIFNPYIIKIIVDGNNPVI